MGVYVKRWDGLKTAFQTATNATHPKEQVKGFLGKTVDKATGVTPVLNEIDTALEKKQRAPLEKAINKLMVVRSSYCGFLTEQQKQFNPMTNDAHMPIWMAYRDLIKGLEDMEKDAAKDAQKLQETKGNVTQGIIFFALEGDVKGTIATAKAKFADHKSLESKHGVLAKADAALAAASTYTKAAARTQAKEARQALEAFKVAAKKCADDLDKVIAKENNADFIKAVKSFQTAMKDFASLSRVDAQINNLKVMEQAASSGH